MTIKEYSFKEKSDLIINYLYDNYSTTKEKLLNENNISDELLFKQFHTHSLLYCPYILFNLDLKDSYISFSLIFEKSLIENKPFFLLKGLSEEEVNFIRENKMNQEDIGLFFCNSILSKNELLLFFYDFNVLEIFEKKCQPNIDSIYSLINLKQELLTF